MIVSVSNTIEQPATCERKAGFEENEIKQIILESIEKVGLNPEECKINEQGHLELNNPNSLKLHSLTLQMEKMGLDIKLTKQTLLEVC